MPTLQHAPARWGRADAAGSRGGRRHAPGGDGHSGRDGIERRPYVLLVLGVIGFGIAALLTTILALVMLPLTIRRRRNGNGR